jgi:hypothetical protein
MPPADLLVQLACQQKGNMRVTEGYLLQGGVCLPRTGLEDKLQLRVAVTDRIRLV